jgi:hypothetical protein
MVLRKSNMLASIRISAISRLTQRKTSPSG